MARLHGKDRGITQRKNRPGWWARIEHHGREQWFKCDTKSQAKAVHGRVRAEIREKTYFPEQFRAKPKAITLQAWIARYLDGCSHLRSYRHQKQYGRWWTSCLGNRLLHELTSEEIAKIQATTIQKCKQAPSTVNRYLSFLRRILNVAIRDGLLLQNPVHGIKFSPEPVGRLRYLSDDEICSLEETMAPEDWLVVAFALETGLRQAEQFKARWEWVNFEARIITIPRSKSGRTRHVALSDGAISILQRNPSWMASPYLFPSPRKQGQPRDGRSFTVRVFIPALRHVSIEGVTWHTLRHTFASRLVMAGVDIRTVQELMGHSTIVQTMRYAHLSSAHLRDAVNRAKLGSALARSSTKTVTKTVTYPTSTILPEWEDEQKRLIYKRELLEAASGIEPLNRSFADCSLNHLGTPPQTHIFHRE